MLGPVQHHIKHHKLWDGSLPRLKDCKKCVIARAKCAGKTEYKNRTAADKKALSINIDIHWWPGECVKPYRCRYCSRWHLTHATRRKDIEFVEKMRRKHFRRTHQTDRNFNYGYNPDDWNISEAD